MKKILLSVLLGVFLVPSVTFASWWNPLSWGKQQATVIQSQTTPVQEAQPVASTTIVEKVIERVIEKPVEKIVTKTITVDNPELQIKINSLIAENVSLKQKIVSLEAQLTQLNSQLSAQKSIEERIAAQKEQEEKESAEIKAGAISAGQENLKDIQRQIAELNYKIAQTRAGVFDKIIAPYSKSISETETARQKEATRLNAEVAKLNIELYK